MRQGVLIYDQDKDRMDIRFGLEDFIMVKQWRCL